MSQSQPPILPPASEPERRSRTPWFATGGIIAIAGILSWVLASATGSNLWYALVAIVAIAAGVFRGRNRTR
jgi:hypothetical protein